MFIFYLIMKKNILFIIINLLLNKNLNIYFFKFNLSKMKN